VAQATTVYIEKVVTQTVQVPKIVLELSEDEAQAIRDILANVSHYGQGKYDDAWKRVREALQIEGIHFRSGCVEGTLRFKS
jgi:hypothetical protein